MEQISIQTRLIFASIFLFAVLFGTSYLQTILHFDTYTALFICFLDTLISAMILFWYSK
ncbi:MAG: hypothetical protein JOZ18_21670 [Chloroflexi bacterium]|nr:hypothetical protein [Chloroflexota bacterium]